MANACTYLQTVRTYIVLTVRRRTLCLLGCKILSDECKQLLLHGELWCTLAHRVTKYRTYVRTYVHARICVAGAVCTAHTYI